MAWSENIFEEIKKSVPIPRYIEALTPSAHIKKMGTGTIRVNPCPICGHKDCFTIDASGMLFKCFSAACDTAGDVIILERILKSHASNLDAAKALIGMFGLNIDLPAVRRSQNNDRPRAPHRKKNTPSNRNTKLIRPKTTRYPSRPIQHKKIRQTPSACAVFAVFWPTGSTSALWKITIC